MKNVFFAIIFWKMYLNLYMHRGSYVFPNLFFGMTFKSFNHFIPHRLRWLLSKAIYLPMPYLLPFLVHVKNPMSFGITRKFDVKMFAKLAAVRCWLVNLNKLRFSFTKLMCYCHPDTLLIFDVDPNERF